MCHDIAPFHGAQVSTWTAGLESGVAPAYGASPFLDVCTAWSVDGKAAAEIDKLPTGDVPTLVATGAFAPYAPEGLLRDRLEGLTKATFAVDPGNGHNVIVSTECLAAARNKWLDELTLAPSDLSCMDDQTAPFVTDLSTVLDISSTAMPSPSKQPATASSDALEGAWLVSLPRDVMTAALSAGGFPDLSERFFREEEVPADGVRFLLVLEDGSFSGVYNDGLDEQGEWYVGWSGIATVQGDQLELSDPIGTSQTVQFTVTGDQLELTPLSATPETFLGIPAMAFEHAYLAAKPFTRIDCADVTPPCACLPTEPATHALARPLVRARRAVDDGGRLEAWRRATSSSLRWGRWRTAVTVSPGTRGGWCSCAMPCRASGYGPWSRLAARLRVICAPTPSRSFSPRRTGWHRRARTRDPGCAEAATGSTRR